MVCETHGKSDGQIHLDGNKCIKGALYVLYLNSNLLIVDQFLGEGYSLVIEDLSYNVFSDTTEKNLLFKLPIAKNNIFLLYFDGEKNMLSEHHQKTKIGYDITSMGI